MVSRQRSSRNTLLRDDAGSSAVEFVLVGAILTVLTALILQIGVALYARNIVHDATVTGAYRAALADAQPGDAEQAVREVTDTTLGAGAVQSVTAQETERDGIAVVEVHVTATLPLLGVLGIPEGWEVSAYAPQESLDIQ